MENRLIYKTAGIHPEFQNEYKRKMNIKQENFINKPGIKSVPFQITLEEDWFDPNKGWEKMNMMLDEHYPEQKENKDLQKISKEYEKGIEELRNHPSQNDFFYLLGDQYIFNAQEDTSVTKGKKESEGKLFYELDWDFIEALAKRMAENKHGKYAVFNWKKQIDKEGLKQAAMRHMIEVMKDNYKDDNNPYGHLLSVALNMMMLIYQLKNYE